MTNDTLALRTDTPPSLEAALDLAERGIPVFPCGLDKRPTCPTGFKAASASPKVIGSLWREHFGPLVGVATGAISGLAILDVDGKHREAHAWWATHRSKLTHTKAHRTRSGGLHLVFQYRDGLRCSAAKIAPGIDVRGDGGYVIWWPAAGYEVLHQADPAPWPAWISALLESTPRPAWTPPKPGPASIARYADAALSRAARSMASTPEGQRNFTLNRQVFCLARHELAIGRERLRAVMSAAAAAAGLPQNEIDRTIEAAFKARDALGGR